MSYELSIDGLALDVPDRARGIGAGGSDPSWLGFVPVEGGQRAAELAVLVAVEARLELDAGVIVGDSPEAEEVAGGGEEIGALALLVGDEDGFGGRVRVLEGEVGIGADLAVGFVELDDLDSVRVLLEEAGDGQAVLFVAADAPVHGVDLPRRFVCVDL